MASSGAAQLKAITEENFEAEVLKSSSPFLLDLTAEWCGPCKAMAVVVSELAAEYAGRVAFGSVDIDKNPKIPARYHVMSIPTLLLFQGGKVVGQLTGANPKARIVSLLAKGL